MYCAATAADCPFVAKKTALAKMAANKQCDGTECPGGCCPYVGWYCCPDGMYCAATAADCPFVAKKTALAKMAANKQCDGTECPGGCCPYVGWYCCPDGMYCAATLFVGSHLDKVCLLSNKWAVSSSSSTVHAIWAAVPSNIWAASSWAFSTITLLVGSPFVAKK